MALSLAIVLPRYGANLGGGAETLTRALFLKLLESGVVTRGEVWTTCAIDHRTWNNELPPGSTIEDGVPVKRFLVDPRDLEPFVLAERKMSAGEQLSLDQQLAWLANSVNSRELYLHIEKEGRNFDLLLFAPYLFATSFWGAMVHPDKSMLIPCLHDEPYAYQQVFGALFSSIKGMIFNSEAERRLADQIYPGARVLERSVVVGMGFDYIPRDNSFKTAHAAKKFNLPYRKYLLYSGRKELGKNLDLLINYYERLSPELRNQIPLVLIGSGDVHFRSELPEGVRDLGFVSEEEKFLLMREALALTHPSTNESFSIVLLEALLEGTPGLVHADCAVTSEHILSADGGLTFRTALEFEKAVELLNSDLDLVERLGEQGKNYVVDQYNWNAVIRRFMTALQIKNECSDAARY